MKYRTLKGDLLTDEKLAPLGDRDWRVFVSLILLADDAGRVLDMPLLLRAQIFPCTPDATIDEALARLAGLGRILRYETDAGQKVLQLVNWYRHQYIPRPNKHVLPPPSRQTVEAFLLAWPNTSLACRLHAYDMLGNKELRNLGSKEVRIRSKAFTHRSRSTNTLPAAAAEVAPLRGARTSRKKRKRADARSPAAAAADGTAVLRGGPTANSTHPTTAATLRARFPLAATVLAPNEDGDPIVAFLTTVPHPDAYLRVVCETLAANSVTPDQARRAVTDWFTNAEPPNIRKFRGYLRTASELPPTATPQAWADALARWRDKSVATPA